MCFIVKASVEGEYPLHEEGKGVVFSESIKYMVHHHRSSYPLSSRMLFDPCHMLVYLVGQTLIDKTTIKLLAFNPATLYRDYSYWDSLCDM